MTQEILQQISFIPPLDVEASASAKQRLDRLTKPLGSLGRLEELFIQLAGITGRSLPSFDNRAVIIMAADHGVCEEGISAFPSEVTRQMVLNFLNGGAAVNVLARQASADVRCVDVGVAGDSISHPHLIGRNIRKGTANMVKEPAMLREEVEQAIQVGYEVVRDAVAEGCQLFITGEMGIGNTTASSAVMSALTGITPLESVGRGTGLTDERMRHKAVVVQRSIELHHPDPTDPVDVLTKVGGLEIAGLAGVILGAAMHRCPVIIDGFISSAAALVAQRLAPATQEYMIASHVSKEQGHALLLKEIGLSPMLDLHMRLGEGTGGVLALHLIDAVTHIASEMATFESAGISGESTS